LPIFNKIIIGIGINSSKNCLFSLNDRKNAVRDAFAGEPKIEIQTYSGLTVNFCKENNIQYILRGLRSAADFDYERTIALMNKEMDASIETVFLLSEPKYSGIHSTVVREIIRYGGDPKKFVPEGVNLKL
jgi:pantetheine-phosphate adenylyltransferase